MDIIPIEIARENGLTRYYTGEPCQNGHTSGRYTKSGVCVGCASGRVFRHAARKRSKDAKITLDIFVPADFTMAQRTALRDWLQFTCVGRYMEHLTSEVKLTI
jgi:hypothetical protein